MNLKDILEEYSATVGERTEVDKIMIVALVLQRIFGHQVLDPNWAWRKFFLHQIFTLLLIIYVFFGTLEVVRTTKDVELIAEAGYTLVLIITCPIKLLLFLTNRFVFRQLYMEAKSVFYDTIRNDSLEKANEVLRQGKRVVFCLIAMVVFPISIYELITAWNYLNGNRSLLSKSTASLMPFSTPYYEISWFLHSVFMAEISTIIIVTDVWFVILLYFFCMAVDSVVKKLNVAPREKEESKALYSQRLGEGLRKFYMAHMDLVSYLNNLKQMYKWLSFVPLCNAAMCICIVLLVLSKEINWRFAPHMVPLFAEIFAYSWFGEQVKTKTTILRTALINFDWINLQTKDKKRYYIIVSYMKKDFGIVTANGTDLSLITMTTVLKSSYQAYTVLQSI